MSKGVTLIEVIVCVAIFAILSVSIYGVFTSIIKGIVYYRDKTTVSSLADQYIEIAQKFAVFSNRNIKATRTDSFLTVQILLDVQVRLLAVQMQPILRSTAQHIRFIML